VRRRAPRPLRTALEAVALESAPAGILARAQRLWPSVAGDAVAAETEPVSEREGVLTVRCESALWAQELELLGPEICARLNGALAGEGEVRELRFSASSAPRQSRTRRNS
jgi:predicted nucleic acid-binding Zn ribbon protein